LEFEYLEAGTLVCFPSTFVVTHFSKSSFNHLCVSLEESIPPGLRVEILLSKKEDGVEVRKKGPK
jgi:hypothetical protein